MAHKSRKQWAALIAHEFSELCAMRLPPHSNRNVFVCSALVPKATAKAKRSGRDGHMRNIFPGHKSRGLLVLATFPLTIGLGIDFDTSIIEMKTKQNVNRIA
jgi:hypothetical protein